MTGQEITYDYEATRGFLMTLQQARGHLENAQSQLISLYNVIQADEDAGSTLDVYTYKGTASEDMSKFIESLYGHLNTTGELINVLQEYLSVYNKTVLNLESDLTTQMSLTVRERQG